MEKTTDYNKGYTEATERASQLSMDDTDLAQNATFHRKEAKRVAEAVAEFHRGAHRGYLDARKALRS